MVYVPRSYFQSAEWFSFLAEMSAFDKNEKCKSAENVTFNY